MLATIETAWLYVRGQESVRLIRVAEEGRQDRLLVYGPGRSVTAFSDDDVHGCLRRQQEIERALLAEGFLLQPHVEGERRSGHDRRGASRGPDRRRGVYPVGP